MFGRNKRLKQWVDAGLISADQQTSIEVYESSHRKGRFGRGLTGLSVLAILVGILSIIASNWYKIPGDVKIGVHTLLNIAVGVFAWHSAKKGRDLWREGATFAFMALTMTLIILVGQVYQLGGEASDAFMLWLVVTLPFFLLLGNSLMTAIPWMAGFLITVGTVLAQKLGSLPPQDQYLIGAGTAVLLPLAMMADGGVDFFRKWKPALADLSLRIGAVMAAGMASFCLYLWRGRDFHYLFRASSYDTQTGMIFMAGLVGLFIHAAFYGFYKNRPAMKPVAGFALISLCAWALPMLMPPAGFVPSALLFMGYWLYIGWIGQILSMPRLISLAITVIALRIFLLYVDLFGNLMDTGLGLILGGVVMLGLIYAARRLNNRMVGKGGAA